MNYAKFTLTGTNVSSLVFSYTSQKDLLLKKKIRMDVYGVKDMNSSLSALVCILFLQIEQ